MKAKAALCVRVVTALALFQLFGPPTQAGLVKLAESGDLEPNGTNQFFLINSDPTINERGQVAFYCDLRNNGFAQGFGFFLSDGETNRTIAKTSQPAPDANGNFNTFHDPAALNASNQVFLANLKGTLGGSTDDTGIYQVSGGILTQLARTGQPAAPNSGTFQSLANASIPVNRGGQAAFVGSGPKSACTRTSPARSCCTMSLA